MNNKRIAALVLFIAIVVLVVGVAITHPLPAQPHQGRAQSTPTTRPITVPTPRATLIPAVVPTAAPTATMQPVSVPTSVAVLSNAQLGSTLASFKAKYGMDTPQSDGVTNFIDPTDNGPLLHGGVLGVTSKGGIVTYITYAGPDNWTHKQYAAMMLVFMPSDAVVVTSTPDLIAYRSVSIGNFDEQFTGVVAGVYSV